MSANPIERVYCPGCAAHLPADNAGCSECGYENGVDGRLLSIGEIIGSRSYPDKGALALNDVCPAFLVKVGEAIAAAKLAGGGVDGKG